MALLFTDGFDSYAATADLLKKWAVAQTPWAWNSTAGPDGGGCAVATTASNAVLTSLAILGNTTRLCVGFFMKVSTLVSGVTFFTVQDLATLFAIRLRTASGGAGFIEAITNGNNLCMSGVKNVCDNQWHWIELDINTVTSSPVRMYVDGFLEFSGYMGLGNMSSLAMSRFFFSSFSGATFSVANVVLWDNNGSALNVSHYPLGPRSIDTIRPNGDGVVNFARSTGSTNFSLVDEVNGDVSDYVEANASGTQDLYDYAPLVAAPTTINGVMLNSYLHTPIPGVISFQPVCKSGSTTSAGTAGAAPSTTPRVIQQAYELDPNGNIPWTAANLDAAQFGVKVA